MFLCVEILAIINTYVLYKTGITQLTSSGIHVAILKQTLRESLFLLILLLPALIPNTFGKLYSIFIYLIFAFFTSANVIHATLYGSPLTSQIILVLQETYAKEAEEFFRQILNWHLLIRALAPFLLSLPFLLLSIRFRPAALRDCWQSTLAVALGVPAVLSVLVLTGFRDWNKHPENIIRWSYFGDFILSSRTIQKDHDKFLAGITQDAKLPPNIHGPAQSGKIVVIVIGESSGRLHYTLYGYPRMTTPNLLARKNQLFTFTDVISPHSHTTSALRKALTFANHEGDPADCSLIDMLKAGGYRVVSLSNQPQLGRYETTPSILLGRAHSSRFINSSNTNGNYEINSYDGLLVDELRSTLSYPDNMAVIIHLMGNHTYYSNRYPHEMKIFTTLPPPEVYNHASLLDKDKIKQINDYDNSIVYTDHVLEQFIKNLEQTSRPAVLVYFSDHGEAVYEDGHTVGHTEAAASKFMFEIPFFIWASPEYKKERSSLFQELPNWTDRPWQTDDLIYPLLNLAGITYDGVKKHKDILSPDFIPEKRIMGKWDYDEFLKKH